MSNSINGIQITSKFGSDFNSQYNVPDYGLTNNTTLSQNPLYAMQKLIFNGAQTNDIKGLNKNDLFIQNGLKRNPTNTGKSSFTAIG